MLLPGLPWDLHVWYNCCLTVSARECSVVFGSVLGPDCCRTEQALAEAVRGTVILQTTKVQSLPDFRSESLM